MFVIETKGSVAAWKASMLMMAALVLMLRGLGPLAALLTLHTYVRPRAQADGFRLFGFRLGR
jgi:hypothetical protein